MRGRLIAEFTVLGTAKPAGSKKAFAHPKTGRIIVTDQSGAAGKTWRNDVRAEALKVMDEPLRGAVGMDITFYRARPKGHYGTGRNAAVVKDSSPAHPTVAPDVDKLSRSVLDALSGTCYLDDAQVVEKVARKRYAQTDRTEIKVYESPEQQASDLEPQDRVRDARSDELPSAQESLLDESSM